MLCPIKQPVLLVVLFCTGVLAGCSSQSKSPGQASASEPTAPETTPDAPSTEKKPPEPPGRTAMQLEPGMRLVTIPVPIGNQPPNLQPGDIVDVYANVMRRSGTQAMLVLERAQVWLVNVRIIEGDQTLDAAYGDLTIELPQTEVAHIMDVQTRIVGNKFLVVLRDHNDIDTQLEAPGVVNPELLEVLGFGR